MMTRSRCRFARFNTLRSRGFTLIELLVVILIILLVTAVRADRAALLNHRQVSEAGRDPPGGPGRRPRQGDPRRPAERHPPAPRSDLSDRLDIRPATHQPLLDPGLQPDRPDRAGAGI